MTAAGDLLEAARQLLGPGVEVHLVLRGGDAESSGRGGNIPPGGDASGRVEWLDQYQSALGPRLHNAAVRRRLDQGQGGAAIKNRRYLLTVPAHDEEMMRSPKPGLRKTTGKTPEKTNGPSEARATLGRSAAAEKTLARLRRLRSRGQKA